MNESKAFFKLLLVDDNYENRLVVKSFLKKSNWQVDEAQDGVEAIKKFETGPYDLVLMDMQMPNMDGHAATREIRQIEDTRNLSRTPIIALTAYGLEEEKLKSLDAGCDDHLTKPFSKSLLFETLSLYTSRIIVRVDEDLRDLVPEFLARRKNEIQEFRTKLSSRDYSWIEHTSHKIGGVAGSYGFHKISEYGKTLEGKAQSKDGVAIEIVLEDYEKYLDRLQIAYK